MNDRIEQIEARAKRTAAYPFADKLSREDVPYLLALVREQQAQIDKVAAIHTPEEVFEIDPMNGTWIYDDKTDERVKIATLCRECTHEGVIEDIESGSYDDGGTDGDVHWPCPTIAALTASHPETES